MNIVANSRKSFEGVYSRPGTKFSAQQIEVINDIKETLGVIRAKEDFFVKPMKDNDSIKLSKVIGLRHNKKNANIDCWYDKFEIGTYNKKQSFKIDDLNTKQKQWNKDNALFITTMGLVLLGLSSLFFIPKPRKINYNEIKTEIINKFNSAKNLHIK